MKNISYKLDVPEKLTQELKQKFLELLMLQGKISPPTIEKIDRCKCLCVYEIDNEIVSIGAIKPITKFNFNPEHADLSNRENDFEFELGYCFTPQQHTNKGYSSYVVKLLLEKYSNQNIMATTVVGEENHMINILTKHNFIRIGKSWESKIEKGKQIGLFLKYANNK